MYFLYYYPVGFDQPRERHPGVTIGLIATMVVVFAWQKWLPGLLPVAPARLVYLAGSTAPWAAVTAIFLHGGWLHLLGNLVYLAAFGPPIEDRLGHGRFLLYFLMLGAWGNVAHGVTVAAGWTPGPAGVLGASGALAGLMAIALVRFYYARVAVAWWLFAPLQGVNRVGRTHVPVTLAAGVWLFLQIVQGMVARESGSRIAFGAHFGGFGLGLFLALALGWHHEARGARKLARARRFLEQGQAWAAEGELLDRLRMAPDDLEALLPLARARRMTGRMGEAREAYRRAHAVAVRDGRGDLALDIYREARRGDAALVLAADDLTRAAFLLEKQGDYRGAVEAFLDLYRYHRRDRRAEFSLARAIVLLRGRLGEPAEAADWLAIVRREFPAGTWREFLESEVRLAGARRAAGRADVAMPPPAPAV